MELNSSQARIGRADCICEAEGVEGRELVWYFGIREAWLGPFLSRVVRADAWQPGTNIEELGSGKEVGTIRLEASHVAISLHIEGASGTIASTGRPNGRIPFRSS